MSTTIRVEAAGEVVDLTIADVINDVLLTVPEGYRSFDSFIPAGGTWLDALPLLTGNVWILPDRDENGRAKQRILTLPASRWVAGAQHQLAVLPKTVSKFDAPGFYGGTGVQTPTDDGRGTAWVVIDVPANTSNLTAAWVNDYAVTRVSVLQQTGGALVSMRGFELRCGDQPHNFHGWSIFEPTESDGEVDIRVRGSKGTGGNPPLECFQGTIRGGKKPWGWKCSGSFYGTSAEGVRGGCVGFTFQQMWEGTVTERAWFSDHNSSSIVAYTSRLVTIKAYIAKSTDNLAAWGAGCFVNIEMCPEVVISGATLRGGWFKKDLHVRWAGSQTAFSIKGSPDAPGQATTIKPGGCLLTMADLDLDPTLLWSAGWSDNGAPIPIVQVWGQPYTGTDVAAGWAGAAYPKVNGAYQGYKYGDRRDAANAVVPSPSAVYLLPTHTKGGTQKPVHTVCYGLHVQKPGPGRMPEGTTV